MILRAYDVFVRVGLVGHVLSSLDKAGAFAETECFGGIWVSNSCSAYIFILGLNQW